ncbi:glucose/arabinose dehydrogenase [Nocardioides ginsengisegetis]|uniref:Glucose/arabinose dehydrogenase n=1 Tax=Nocardioides ginsengisegetis TaxID=661491 RepID=A0A7W3J153_9ACTN|nr:glucose/arabinose dehydrogenase [Nocardioides ginsengisegetis]
MRRGAVALVAIAALAGCTSGGDSSNQTDDTVTASPAPASGATSEGPSKPAGTPRVVGTIATGLAVPWGLAFLPDGDAIVTERDTRRVLLIHGPRHVVRVITTIGEPVGEGAAGESGLLGVAVSPDFASDHLLYFYVTTPSDNRIERATYDGGRLGDLEVVLDGIPNGYIHDGGRLAFGPDGYLYASTGETGDDSLAQDKDSLGGKILRITPDGDPAPGNPFGTPVFSYGHRNVQGLAFDDAGHLWASEFGHDLFDELNLIVAGHDYGWPVVEGRGDAAGMTNPQVVWDPSVASPSGLAYLDGELWLGSLRGMRLWRIDVHGTRASHPTDFFVGEYGRMRTVAVAPDGRLWVTTSNRDGRGAPVEGDDRILLVDPTGGQQ